MVASIKGRCAGCQKTGPVREIERHTTACEKYAALYVATPERALAPADEFLRYQREERSEEALELRRQTDLDAKKLVYQEQAERKLDEARGRWGLREAPPLRTGPSSPVDPESVVGAVLSTVRPGLPPALEQVAGQAAAIYGGATNGESQP